MKKIEVYIRPEKLENLKAALEAIDCVGMSATDVRGRGEQKGIELEYRGKKVRVDMLPKTKVEVFVKAERVDEVVAAMCKAAYTGKPGDGRIYISAVEKALKVRDGSTME